VKNDERDAKDLAAMLRLGRLAEGWIAPPKTRELRELVRYRHSLVGNRTSAKAQIHGVMAKNGVLPVVQEMWGPAGSAQLDSLELPFAYSARIESLRDLLELYEREIDILDRHIHRQLRNDPGYRAITNLPGVGKVTAAIFIAEIGDVSRFSSPKKLCSWTGLTPKHRESDEIVHRGAITKMACGAASPTRAGSLPLGGNSETRHTSAGSHSSRGRRPSVAARPPQCQHRTRTRDPHLGKVLRHV
jgi:transposase